MKKKNSYKIGMIRVIFFVLLIASLAGLFIAYQFSNDSAYPLLYTVTPRPSGSVFPFVVEDNLIELREDRLAPDCLANIQVQVKGLDDGLLLPDARENIVLAYEMVSIDGVDFNVEFVHADIENETLDFQILRITPDGGALFGVWLHNHASSTHNQLSPEIYFNMSPCEVNVAQFNFIQVGEIP